MAVTNNFAASTLDLNGQITINQPTALVWGPDGRLYVTEADGDVRVLTVAFGDKNPLDADNTAQFYVTEAITLSLIKGAIQNHNDNGSTSGGVNRQVTGIDVTQQFDVNGDPVLIDGKPAVTIYVSSSDSRIGAGGGGGDINLDTNSGVITKMVQTGPNTWDAIDIVRGLTRSEENHATNGMEVIQEIDPVTGKLVSERMIVASTPPSRLRIACPPPPSARRTARRIATPSCSRRTGPTVPCRRPGRPTAPTTCRT